MKDENKQTLDFTKNFMLITEIKNRVSGDTRELDYKHVFSTAHSIYAVGLIAPIAIDNQNQLLAGGHRLMAMKLLNLETRAEAISILYKTAQQTLGSQYNEKLDDEFNELREQLPIELDSDLYSRIEVKVFDFDSTYDHKQAIGVEVAENAIRKDYSSKEIYDLYQKLLALGYSDSIGRPKLGEQKVKPLIANIIGKSERTVKRKLDEFKKQAELTDQQKQQQEMIKTVKSLNRLHKQLNQLPDELKANLSKSLEAQMVIPELLSALTQLLETPSTQPIADVIQVFNTQKELT